MADSPCTIIFFHLSDDRGNGTAFSAAYGNAGFFFCVIGGKKWISLY